MRNLTKLNSAIKNVPVLEVTIKPVLNLEKVEAAELINTAKSHLSYLVKEF
jgi:hypothetical protein